MKCNRPFHICILFKHNNRADRERLSGVCRFAAERRDWDIRIIDRSSSRFADEAARLRRDWPVDGTIYSADNDYPDALRRVGALKSLRAEMDPPGSAPGAGADVSVRADARGIMADIVALLIRRGYANFGFFGTEDPDECDYSQLCERHFSDALRRTGHAVSVFRETADTSWSECHDAASAWAKELPKPCAVLAYTDDLARDLLNASQTAHLDVPGQVAILGIDDAHDICETCRPTLSSVRLDFEMSGYRAAEALDRVLRRGGSRRCQRITYGIRCIVERQSTQDVRGCGRIVGAATELIRTLPLETLTATEIARRLHVSRRLLEVDFKKILGRGVHAQILQRRLETLHDRLMKSAAPVGELALACGFRTAAAARIAYRKRYGRTMSSERKDFPDR